jgi:hypothetical protein
MGTANLADISTLEWPFESLLDAAVQPLPPGACGALAIEFLDENLVAYDRIALVGSVLSFSPDSSDGLASPLTLIMRVTLPEGGPGAEWDIPFGVSAGAC